MNATIQAVATKPRAVVLFDGDCRFCQKTVGILRSLDWFNRLEYVSAREPEKFPDAVTPVDPMRAIEEMHLVTPDKQKTYAGFRAVRWIAGRLPAMWIMYPFLFIPGVPQLGQKVYLWIAKNRMGIIPCKDGVCEIPVKK
jgi:predicted DCC family thiol-disulfide oxidoreductase YuxK